MRVYSYYSPAPIYSEDSQRRLIDVWERSWRKQGWEPIVLNEGDAALHSWYDQFKKHVWELPTEYGHEYESACFLRWLAMAAQETDGGGGMLTDYDVVNYTFPPRSVDHNQMSFFADFHPFNTISMGAVLGSKKHYEYFCNLFMNWTPHPQHDWNKKAKLFHCSDLSLLVRMFEDKTFPKPDWARKVPDTHAIFVNERTAWKVAPLVHYGYHMHHAGFWPKHEYIEKLRPF